MSAIVFGQPIYVWGGITALVFFLLTFFFGLNIGKYGMKWHRIFAYLTLAAVLGHAFYGIKMYFF